MRRVRVSAASELVMHAGLVPSYDKILTICRFFLPILWLVSMASIAFTYVSADIKRNDASTSSAFLRTSL